ncbi:MAG TPA: SRPBCC domain-containing protein [Micromonosporaceae bacterium]|jgi:uncharacterized protein YndB with AHSA1/START domain
MPHEFEVREVIALEATPEQVWEAISTGRGLDSWFMGTNEIEPGEGGRVRTTVAGETSEATITAWDPPNRLAYRTDENPDGTFMAFEYLVEGRAGGSAVLRLVHGGFLGDDWQEEYDALSVGDGMYLRKLAAYLRHFPGRTAAYHMFLPGPAVADAAAVWRAFTDALGRTGTVAEGDEVRLAVDGLEATDGVVEFVHHPSFLGVRTEDGLYLFVYGYRDTVVLEYHGFAEDVDGPATERAWRTWLSTSFGG